MRAETIWELLHAGDWACANGDEESLARVARSLARRVGGDQRLNALTVAATAVFDMGEATLRWGMLTDELRAAGSRV